MSLCYQTSSKHLALQLPCTQPHFAKLPKGEASCVSSIIGVGREQHRAAPSTRWFVRANLLGCGHTRQMRRERATESGNGAGLGTYCISSRKASARAARVSRPTRDALHSTCSASFDDSSEGIQTSLPSGKVGRTCSVNATSHFAWDRKRERKREDPARSMLLTSWALLQLIGRRNIQHQTRPRSRSQSSRC